MAYEKIAWKNREVEKPRTYTKVDNSDGTITLTPAEGNIIEPGTPIIADNMNHIEQGIEDVDQAIDMHISDSEKHIPYATASGTNTYTVSIPGISSLAEGLSIKVKFTNANTGAATLNVNSLGAKSIVKSNGNALSSGNIKAGQICHLVYTGSNFQLLGEGGEYGTAQAGDVLAGKTIGTEAGLVEGTLEQLVTSGQYTFNNDIELEGIFNVNFSTDETIILEFIANKSFWGVVHGYATTTNNVYVDLTLRNITDSKVMTKVATSGGGTKEYTMDAEQFEKGKQYRITAKLREADSGTPNVSVILEMQTAPLDVISII